MKKIVLSAGVGVLILVTAVVSFRFGVMTEHNKTNSQLAAVQAMLAFNHSLRYQELESDLSRGCVNEALEKSKISRDLELKLVSSFMAEYPSTSLNKYISDRDPSLLEKLISFKSAYGDSWTEPTCKK